MSHTLLQALSTASFTAMLQAHEADSKARRHPTPWAYIRSLAWVRGSGVSAAVLPPQGALLG